MTTTNGWPDKPGVPMNPEKDGSHWISHDEVSQEPALWNAKGNFWQLIGAEECFSPRDMVVRKWRYLGPCLTPEEATALQKKGCARDQNTTQFCAEVISRDARIVELENLVAYLCGKNTDHIRVALAGNPTVVDAVVARAEAALEGGKKDE